MRVSQKGGLPSGWAANQKTGSNILRDTPIYMYIYIYIYLSLSLSRPWHLPSDCRKTWNPRGLEVLQAMLIRSRNEQRLRRNGHNLAHKQVLGSRVPPESKAVAPVRLRKKKAVVSGRLGEVWCCQMFKTSCAVPPCSCTRSSARLSEMPSSCELEIGAGVRVLDAALVSKLAAHVATVAHSHLSVPSLPTPSRAKGTQATCLWPARQKHLD